VTEDFFATMRIPLLAGRPLEARDLQPDSDAVVVDESFARQYFPNQNPLGRRFGLDEKNNSKYQILGVVRDTRYNSLRDETMPTVYQPLIAEESSGATHFVIRTSLDSIRLAASVRQTVAAVDAAVPLNEFHTQTGLIDRLLRTERLLGFLSIALGVIAVTLAAIGLGGLLAYAVARRTNEIGVRMALGAAGGDVIRMVLNDSAKVVTAGLLIGLPGAYLIGQALKTMLFQLEPLDVRTVTLSFLVLIGVALFAAWIPARRAARIDPLTALREE
jgi:predicted permease